MNTSKDFKSFQFKPIGKNKQSYIEIEEDNKTLVQKIIYTLQKNKGLLIGAIMSIIILLLALIIPFVSKDPYFLDSTKINAAPSWENLFGNDKVGRDLWSRVWWGVLFSLLLGLVTSLINSAIGATLGVLSGTNQKFDKFIQFILKIFRSVPVILVLILVNVTLGSSFGSMILGLTIIGWIPMTQQVRTMAKKNYGMSFVLASNVLGTPKFKINLSIFRLCLPIVITQFLVTFPTMILSESVLGFLGLSVPDMPTIGNIINSARTLFFVYPTQTIIPVVFLVYIVLSLRLVGGSLQKILNKR